MRLSLDDARSNVDIINDDSWVKAPFDCHADYIAALKSISIVFRSEMGRKSANNNTLLPVLRSGPSYAHFSFLQNGALFTKPGEGQARSHGGGHNQ